MDYRNIPRERLAMVCKAIKEVEDECLDELKAVAFEALLLNPGSDYGDWEQELIHNYHTEVVDMYGNDPEEVYSALRDLWEEDYHDTATDTERTFEQWAAVFCNDETVQFYYDCADKIGKTRFKGLKNRVRAGCHYQ